MATFIDGSPPALNVSEAGRLETAPTPLRCSACRGGGNEDISGNETSFDRAAPVVECWLAMRAAVLLTLLLATPAAATEPPAACGFGAGALPVDTLPPGTPHGAAIPLDHVLVLMQENRSFDHYFGHLHAEGPPRADAEPPPAVN